jgi:hypothetical protein
MALMVWLCVVLRFDDVLTTQRPDLSYEKDYKAEHSTDVKGVHYSIRNFKAP